MNPPLHRLVILCRGDSDASRRGSMNASPLAAHMRADHRRRLRDSTAAWSDWWRAPLQAAYTAIKMPLLIFLTCGGNALLNGLLAQVLGSGLSFRQTSLAILMSFTIASLVLAALSPVAFFISSTRRRSPPPRAAPGTASRCCATCFSSPTPASSRTGVCCACWSAAAKRDPAARRVFWSWLAGNLFLGAQLSWVLRPFIGTPGLAIEFLRDDPMRGNFYESVFHALRHLLR